MLCSKQSSWNVVLTAYGATALLFLILPPLHLQFIQSLTCINSQHTNRLDALISFLNQLRETSVLAIADSWKLISWTSALLVPSSAFFVCRHAGILLKRKENNSKVIPKGPHDGKRIDNGKRKTT